MVKESILFTTTNLPFVKSKRNHMTEKQTHNAKNSGSHYMCNVAWSTLFLRADGEE